MEGKEVGIGQSWATPENDAYEGERDLHIDGTRFRGNAIDFWMFNPPLRQGDCLYRCGICKQPMEKLGKCPICYKGIEKEAL